MSVLPTKKSQPVTGITAFTYLFHSIPKGGKTTLASMFPRPLFLDTQHGTKTMAVDVVHVPDHVEVDANGNETKTTWDVIGETVGELISKESRDKWDTIVIDLANDAYDMLCEKICTEKGVKHIGDIGYGKGTEEANRRFRNFLDTLRGAGYCIVLCCHSKTVKDESGPVQIEKLMPEMPGKMKQALVGWTDIVIYISVRAIEIKRDKKGEEEVKDPDVPRFSYERIAICSPRPGVEAGGRLSLPDEIVLSPDPREGYERLKSAIEKAATERLALLKGQDTPTPKTRKK